MSVCSSIPLIDNKKREEKVQRKKEESQQWPYVYWHFVEEQSTYTDIFQKDTYGKKVQDRSEKENWNHKFQFFQIDNDSKNKITLTSPTDYIYFVEILLELYGPRGWNSTVWYSNTRLKFITETCQVNNEQDNDKSREVSIC